MLHCAAGLRALQARKELERLVKRVKATRDGMPIGTSLLHLQLLLWKVILGWLAS